MNSMQMSEITHGVKQNSREDEKSSITPCNIAYAFTKYVGELSPAFKSLNLMFA